MEIAALAIRTPKFIKIPFRLERMMVTGCYKHAGN
jgi:hypothetical protein